MKMNKTFLIIVQIMLLSISAHVIWATAQAADVLYKITPTKATYSPEDTISINFSNLLSAVGVSPDGTKVLFNSDFGDANRSKDTYMSYFK